MTRFLADAVDPKMNLVQAKCFPLYSILLALENPTVDYFSLDIEGAEFEVLKTIPFDKVPKTLLLKNY